jgi:hypothetical protein
MSIYLVHDTTGDDLGLLEHPAPSLELAGARPLRNAVERFLSAEPQAHIRSECHREERGCPMRGHRRLQLSIIAVAFSIAAVTAVASAALFVAAAAADPPQGLTVREPLSNVPTGACSRFAPGDVLTFTGLTLTDVSEKTWYDPETGEFRFRRTTLVSASAANGGYSYKLDATLHITGVASGDFTMFGQTRIARSDGRIITGDAHIYFDHLGGDVYRLEWLSGPRGADCRS